MNITPRVIKVLAHMTEYDPDDITPEMKLVEDLGLDSLDRELLAGDLEHYFGAYIPEDAESGWVTVQDVIDAAHVLAE